MSKSCLMRFLVAILVLYLQVYTLYSVAKGVERHPSAIVLPPHPTAVMRLEMKCRNMYICVPEIYCRYAKKV